MGQDDESLECKKHRALACIQAGNLKEARVLYTEICRVQQDDAQTWFLLGAINGQLGLMDEAIECCHKTLAVQPTNSDAHFNLAQAYMHQNKLAPAATSFREVVRLQPDHAIAWNNLGYALQEQGQPKDAVGCYREALRLRPDLTATRYLLAALGVAPTPAQAPAEYVAGLFDNYADRFDTHLVQELGYRTPELLNRAIRQALGKTRTGLQVLDLGCGTGLCGPLLRDLAQTLVGVDLSPRMIEKAREKNIYNELQVGELLDVLQSPNRYDLIIAADVFPYVGDLSAAFRACHTVLRPDGLFAFSAEAADEGTSTYLLRNTDRYAHAEGYLRELAESSNLTIVSANTAVLRHHKNTPIDGYLFVTRRMD